MGSARREPTAEMWKESLGEYPEDFLNHLDYQCTDLSMVETLRHLPDYIDDLTYFLSVPPERYADAIQNLKEAGCLDDPEKLEWLSRNPLGTILNLLIIYQLWLLDIYGRNRFIALTIILVKILLITSQAPVLAIFYWNHFWKQAVHRRGSDLCN